MWHPPQQPAGWNYHHHHLQQPQGAPQPSDPTAEWAAKAAEWARQRQAVEQHAQQYEPQFSGQPPPPTVSQHMGDPPPLMPSYNSAGQLYGAPLAKPPYIAASSRTSQADEIEMAIEPLEPHPPPLMGQPPGLLSHPLQQHGPPKRNELMVQQTPPPASHDQYLRPPTQGPPSLVHAPHHEFYAERIPMDGQPPLREPYTRRDPSREPPVQGPSADGFNQPPFMPQDHPDAPYFPPTIPHAPQDSFYVPPAYPVVPPVDTEVPSIPEVKKKVLPAWLREGLEKVARDKQKQQVLEDRKKAEMQGREGSRWSDEEEETQGGMEEENLKEHAAFVQSSTSSSGPSRPRGILKKAPAQVSTVQVEERPETEEMGEEEGEEEEEESDHEVVEKMSDEEMLVKVKKLTIEILMAVTDSEMSAVAEEVMREMRTPRTSRWDVKAEPTQQTRSEQGNAQRRRKTPEGPNKILSLGAYESDDSASGEDEEREDRGELCDTRKQALTNPYPDLPKAGSVEEDAIERAFGSGQEQVGKEKAGAGVDSLAGSSSRAREGNGVLNSEERKLHTERDESAHSQSVEDKLAAGTVSSNNSASSRARSPEREEHYSRPGGKESPAELQEGRRKRNYGSAESGQQRKKRPRSLSSETSGSCSPERQPNDRKGKQFNSKDKQSHLKERQSPSKDRQPRSRDRRSRSRDRRSRSRDRRSRSKDRQSQSRDREPRLKDREGRSKNRRSRSRDRRSHSKDREPHSKDRQSRSKDKEPRSRDRQSRSKDRRSLSKDREPRSKDKRSQSTDREPRSKDRRSRSRDRWSRSRDREHRSRDRRSRSRDKRSRSNDREPRSKDRRSRSKDREHRSRDRRSRSRDKRSRSKDREHRSRDRRSRSNDREPRSKDRRSRSRDRRSRSRDRWSRSKDKRSRSRDRRSRSKDREPRSKDRWPNSQDKQTRKKRQRSGSSESSQSGDQERQAHFTSRAHEQRKEHKKEEKEELSPLSSREHHDLSNRVSSDQTGKDAAGKGTRRESPPSGKPAGKHTQQARKRAARSLNQDTSHSVTSDSDSDTTSSTESSLESSGTTGSARKKAKRRATGKKKKEGAEKHRGRDRSPSTPPTSKRKKAKRPPSPSPGSKDKAHGRDRAHTGSSSKSRKKKKHS